MKSFKYFGLLALILAAGTSFAAPRDVVFRSIDFDTNIIELFNSGATDEDLSGWRFCSHDEDQVRVYSSGAGLNGVTIEAGTSLFVHVNNDAPGGDTDRVNASTVGALASPLDNDSWSIQIYFPPVSFGNGNTIADHLQWSIDGIDNTTADERSDEAESGGVWTDQSLWISTSADTRRIELDDAALGTVLNSPADYSALGPLPVPAGGPLGIALLAIAGIVGLGLVVRRLF